MNMLQFDKGVWLLHRKLHHRFLKNRKYFVEATEDLPDYQMRDGQSVTHAAKKNTTSKTVCKNVISLLTDSEDDESSTEDES